MTNLFCHRLNSFCSVSQAEEEGKRSAGREKRLGRRPEKEKDRQEEKGERKKIIFFMLKRNTIVENRIQI